MKPKLTKKNTDELPVHTYQTRLKNLPEAQQKALDDCASLLSHVKHKLFAKVQAEDEFKGSILNQTKSSFLSRFGISARHFNSIWFQLRGMCDSYKSNLKRHIADNQERLKNVNKNIEKLIKKEVEPEKQQKLQRQIHQKKRRLAQIEKRLEQLKSDEKTGQVRICFGSKKLFKAQFNLEANNYESFEQWKEDWEKARHNQFVLMGSKDETSGNQLCSARLQEDGTFTLRLRLPDNLVPTHGKYLEIPSVKFEYGQEVIEAALLQNKKRRERKTRQDFSYKYYGQAITYRFLRDAKGWRVFVIVAKMPINHLKTIKHAGTIGIDLNANHVAMTETDRFGNPIVTQTLKLNTYGKSQGQTEAIIGEVVKKIVKHSEETLKPIVIEDLDFSKKKNALRENSSKRHARMLSSFIYSKFKESLESRAFRCGVRIYKVNPAYTSVIGRVKFAHRYGLTVHHAAALAIARRLCRFSERAPSGCRNEVLIPNNKGGHVTFSLPVRNRGKHVWSFWRRASRKLKSVVHVAHVGAAELTVRSSQTQGPLVGMRGPPLSRTLSGAIPARESLGNTVRPT